MTNHFLQDTKYDDFRKKVVSFIEEKMTPYAVEWESKRLFPDHLLKDFADEKLIGLSLPVDQGGLGKDFWYEVIFNEALAKSHMAGAPSVIAVHSNMSLHILSELATKDQVERFVKPAVTGDMLLALGITESGSGSDVLATQTVAKLEGDHYIINGSKKYINGAFKGDAILVFCRTNEKEGPLSFSLIMVPTDIKGVTQNRLDTTVLNSGDLGEITFDNVKVPKENLLGRAGLGYEYQKQAIQRERLLSSIAVIALTQEVINATKEFLKNRQRFGESLIKKQVLRHGLVDDMTKLEAARQLAYTICDKHMKGGDINKDILMLKNFTAETCQNIIRHCVQLHGASGFLRSNWISHVHTDVQVFGIFGGTLEILREMLANESKM